MQEQLEKDGLLLVVLQDMKSYLGSGMSGPACRQCRLMARCTHAA